MNTSLDIQWAYGESVRRFRGKRRLSQESLALVAGLNRTHIYKIEGGSVNPNLITTFRLCEGLGVSFTQLARQVEKNLKTRHNHRQKQ